MLLTGSSESDTLVSTAGNDVLDGGGGTDTAHYSGAASNFVITKTTIGYQVVDQRGTKSTDTLTGVERLKFDDVYVALDVEGSAGMAYRLYQAAFNRKPDAGGLGYQLTALDRGLDVAQVAAHFMASPEFQSVYGASSDAQLVTQFYRNVLHRDPDAGGLAFHLGNLASSHARANVLAGFSESPENQAALIGVMQNGMVYTL